MIPSARLLWLAFAWLVFAVAAAWLPELRVAWWFSGGVIALIAIVDAVIAWRRPLPVVHRHVPASLALGVTQNVRLTLKPPPYAARVALFDHHPTGTDARGLPLSTAATPGEWVELGYSLTPVQRGELRFGRVSARIDSPVKLWQRRALLGEAQLVRVYPNYAAVTKYALLAIDNHLSQIGILQRRRRGEGMEFESLREYREGDSLRRIDWKATARSGKLIARNYRDERDQQVIFLLDCSRRMSAKDGPLSHFDHALNAMLLLAYVALSQGDAVGLATFAGPTRVLAPRKSAGSLNKMLNSVYDLQPSLSVPDYYGAALSLLARVKKRALIVILSNLRDEDDATLRPALKLLGEKHLVLFANLREAVLDSLLREPSADLEGALTYAASVDYLAQRRRAFERITRSGAITMDVAPEQLAVALVNRYLEVKRTGVL